MKNKSHDITKGELSAESQERRLRNYDPAKQPCKQGNLYPHTFYREAPSNSSIEKSSSEELSLLQRWFGLFSILESLRGENPFSKNGKDSLEMELARNREKRLAVRDSLPRLSRGLVATAGGSSSASPPSAIEIWSCDAHLRRLAGRNGTSLSLGRGGDAFLDERSRL